MSRYGVTPNMLVLPPQMLLYMALAPEQKLSYKEGGPAAEARFEAGVAGFEARSFRGCGVFTSGAAHALFEPARASVCSRGSCACVRRAV